MAEKSCVICGGDENEGPLVEAPCGTHWVCHDDVSSFFERATDNESLFPPKCCDQLFLLQDYEQYVNFDKAWAYQVKEQGEYAVQAKFRIYCSNGSCAKFLHPSTHVTDEVTKITSAMCEDPTCGTMTCTGCRVLLNDGTENHVCTKNDEEEKFKKVARENGYQECATCGATVELIEACNHITCECGHDFCYICGIKWDGLHACPHYGKPEYDDEGYNQDGFHRTTGLNRDGLTRSQDIARRRGEDPDAEDEDDGEEADIDWEVLQHLTPDQRIMINALENAAREDALDQLRIELFEQQGIMFGQDAEGHGLPRFQPHPLIQQLLQQTIATFVARAPADEGSAEELIQDSITDITPDLLAWTIGQMDSEFDLERNREIPPEHLRTIAEHFTRDRDIAGLDMDPALVTRLGDHLADQLVRHAHRFTNGQSHTPHADQEQQDANANANIHEQEHPTNIDHSAFGISNIEHANYHLFSAEDLRDLGEAGAQAADDHAVRINAFMARFDREEMAARAEAGGPTGNSSSEGEDAAGPDTPMDVDGEQAQGEKKANGDDEQRIWGPPGGWPEEEEDGEL